jgi:hypothetical protein
MAVLKPGRSENRGFPRFPPRVSPGFPPGSLVPPKNRKTFRLSPGFMSPGFRTPGLEQLHAQEFSGILAELLTLRLEFLRHAV